MAAIFPYVTVDGFKWPNQERYPVENFREIQGMQLEADDLVICAYMRSGSNWLIRVLGNILTNGHPPSEPADLFQSVPLLDVYGMSSLKKQEGSDCPFRKMTTHVALPFLPFQPIAKYLVIVRNPFYCCGSLYYLLNSMRPEGQRATFDDFFEMFLSGEMGYGDFFDFIVPWYARRCEPNVKIMVYEKIIQDKKKCVLDVAEFLGEEYLKKLKEDEETLERILEKIPLDHQMDFSLKDVAKALPKYEMKEEELVKKGVAGDWKTLFSEDQQTRLKEKMTTKLAGTDILDFWLQIIDE